MVVGADADVVEVVDGNMITVIDAAVHGGNVVVDAVMNANTSVDLVVNKSRMWMCVRLQLQICGCKC